MFDEYFSRHYPLDSIGKENQLKLKYRKVVILGLGGLGTVSANLLASLGIGNLRLVDFDVVETSNLARQMLYCPDDVGKSKVEQAKKRLEERNPFIKIEDMMVKIDAINVESIISGADIVIDALDKFQTRRIAHRAARKLKIPYIFAGAIAETGNVMSFDHSDNLPCLECVIGDVADKEDQSCAILGVNPIILHLTVGIQINDALKFLLDMEPILLGKMQMIDISYGEFETIIIKKKQDCRLCGQQDQLNTGKTGETTKGQREIGQHGTAQITSLCGRDTYIFDPKWDVNWEFNEVIHKIGKLWEIRSEGRNYVTFILENANISLVDTGVATIRKSGKVEKAVSLMDKVFSQLKN